MERIRTRVFIEADVSDKPMSHVPVVQQIAEWLQIEMHQCAGLQVEHDLVENPGAQTAEATGEAPLDRPMQVLVKQSFHLRMTVDQPLQHRSTAQPGNHLSIGPHPEEMPEGRYWRKATTTSSSRPANGSSSKTTSNSSR